MENNTNDEYYEFDEQAITATVEALRQQSEGADLRATPDFSVPGGGELVLRAQCIEVATSNKRICLRLPFGLGDQCIPLPFDLPDGSAVKVCLDIKWCGWGPFKFPCGVCIKVNFGGEEIVKACFP